MSVKTYASSDKTQLSTHFNVQEFKCKCGKSHDILASSELIDKLELLYSALNCSKIIVNSGYRCTMHDKNVGGTGSGQHTKGTAADIVCYGQDGNPISSKKVSCKAQDIGFTGIANITSAYTSTHVDVRTGKKWYGDETKGTNTVTDDFYKYYGISKNTDSEKNDVIFGIDVSKHQGNINWSHVKADGVKFAIISAGYGKELSQKDSQFENNYAGCKSNGIPCGVYWYSYAKTVAEAKQEAQVCLQVIAGKTLEYPVYFDLEEPSQFALGMKACSDIVQAFCDEIEKDGYYAGLYCSTYYLTNYISDSIKKRYSVWVAQYNDKCTYTGNYGIWQKSREGSVYGISGDVDIDECYIDYPTVIKKAGLNGFSASDVPDKNVGKTENDTGDTDSGDTLEQILQHVKSIDEKMG
jgi:GH25 family lysozyme M1 (1,4-beta-N-acetylmuramidase)